MPNGKDSSIETLRCIAVVLMVAGHIIGASPATAMQVSDDSPWRLIYTALEDIRMPLFTVISGYLYGFRPVASASDWRSITASKSRRLLIPMAFIGTLVFWLKLVTPGTNVKPDIEDFWRPYVYWYDHLWFLQAIFLVFLAVGLLDLAGALRRKRAWGLALLAAIVLYWLAEVPSVWNFFSLSGAIRLLPFFLLGYGLKVFAFEVGRRRAVLVAFLVFLGAYAFRVADIAGVWSPHVVVDKMVAVAVGVPAVLLLFWFRHHLNNKVLAWVGSYAFGVYLLHWFAYSAARIGLRAVGFDADWLVFTAGMVAGIGLPILFQVLTRNYANIRLLFFGERIRYPHGDYRDTSPHQRSPQASQGAVRLVHRRPPRR